MSESAYKLKWPPLTVKCILAILILILIVFILVVRIVVVLVLVILCDLCSRLEDVIVAIRGIVRLSA